MYSRWSFGTDDWWQDCLRLFWRWNVQWRCEYATRSNHRSGGRMCIHPHGGGGKGLVYTICHFLQLWGMVVSFIIELRGHAKTDSVLAWKVIADAVCARHKKNLGWEDTKMQRWYNFAQFGFWLTHPGSSNEIQQTIYFKICTKNG